MVSLPVDVAIGYHSGWLANSRFPREICTKVCLFGRQRNVKERVCRNTQLVKCMSNVPNEAITSELPKKSYGPASVTESEFISFYGASDLRTVEMSTADGSKCRILVDEARVTSYEAMMWHGAVEEVIPCRMPVVHLSLFRYRVSGLFGRATIF